MGCGKSTFGKKLSKALGYQFIDLDQEITKNTGMSIPELFELHGENHFRTIEQETLTATFSLSDTVVACGGGCPCFFDNIDQINQHGVSVYIQMHPKSLFIRLKQNTDTRPLLKNKTDEALLDYINQKLNERKVFYEKAQHIVKGENLKINELVDLLNLGK